MVPGPLSEKTLGDPAAPVTVVEYASMTCPHCARFANDTFDAFKTKYIDTGKAFYILREFPLDQLALVAIVGARCAPEDKFFPIVEKLFREQNDWAFVDKPAPALIARLADEGAERGQFRACIADKRPRREHHQRREARRRSLRRQRNADVLLQRQTPRRRTDHRRGRRADGAAAARLANEAVDVVGAEADVGVVLAAHVDLGEDVLVAERVPVRIDVEHDAVDLKERDHLGEVFRHDEGVGLAGRLVDVAALLRHPVVLEVAPPALQDVAVDRIGVAVARQHAGAGDLQEIDPVALRHGEAERAEPDVRRLRHPDALVLGERRRDDQIGGHLGGLRQPVGSARVVVGGRARASASPQATE